MEEDLSTLAAGKTGKAGEAGGANDESDLEPELGLWGMDLILHSLLLPLHLPFQEGITPTVGW